MFSQLGPLFKTVLRQTESADTRLAIRRDEKQDQGRKDQNDNAPDEPSPLWEDSTIVSVAALQTFLMDFLKDRGEEPPSAVVAETGGDNIQITPEYRPPANMTAARAVKAYGAAANEAPPSPPPEPETSQSEPDVDLASLLKADELRTIHQLIRELEDFKRRGVQTLTIEKADTFLEALVKAVALEKTRL